MKTKETTINNAKQFATVQEWLKSNPKEEDLKKVLDLVNRAGKREMRIELYKKEAELKKASKFVLSMVEMGFKPTAEVTARIDALTNEVKTLKDQLPAPVKREKKAKKDVVETKEE